MGITEATPYSTKDVTPPAPGPETDRLFERAAAGDESCLPQVDVLLSGGARGEMMALCCGSAAEWLRQAVTDKMSGGDLLIREAAKRTLRRVRSELQGPNPTPIERLLAERAAICWQIANWHESNFINSKGLSITQADHAQRKIDRAHRRFLSAVETLARVRKLAVPILQVNVAKSQQVNTAVLAGDLKT